MKAAQPAEIHAAKDAKTESAENYDVRAENTEKSALPDMQEKKEAGSRRREKEIYHADLPKQIYLYFLRTAEAGELPSLHKFAVRRGMTTEDLLKFRSHKKFDRALRECEQIRRDFVIDAALFKKADGSFAKFLLGAEFGMGEKSGDEERELAVTLEVIR